MTTVGDAILAAITANWNVGTGGVEPVPYNTEDVKNPPTDDDFIEIIHWSYERRRDRQNESYVGELYDVILKVSSKNDTNKEERLDTMVNELYRILTPANVSGFNEVDIVFETRSPSGRDIDVYMAALTIRLEIYSTPSASVPGSVTTSTMTVAELTATSWVKTPLIKSIGGVNVMSLSDDDATFADDVTVGGELIFDTAILHAQSNDFHMHPASGNADIKLVLHPLGTNTKSFLQVRNTVNPANYGGFEFTIDGAVASLNSVSGGTGTKPSTLNIDDADWDAINIGDASATVNINGRDINAALMISSANAEWIPCAFMIEETVGKVVYSGADYSIINVDGTDTHLAYNVTLPMTRGGLSLYIKGVQVILEDADASDYVTRVRVTGLTFDAIDEFGDIGTNRQAPGKFTSSFAAQDCSGFDEVNIYVQNIMATGGEYGIRGVQVQCYYA